jgi:PAS domain-containing protein
VLMLVIAVVLLATVVVRAGTAKSGSIATLEMPSFAYEGRWLLFQTFPYRNGAACLFREITDELDARVQIDTKAATLAALAVHGDVGRAKLSARGTFTEVDAAFAAFARFTPEALVHARLTDIVVVRQRHDARGAIEAVLDGSARQRLEVDLLTKDGAEMRVRIGLAPLRIHNRSHGAVAVITRRQFGEGRPLGQ